MRLLLAITEMGVGGAEAVVCELAQAAAERGDDVAVAASPGPLDARLAELPIERRELAAIGRSPVAVATTAIGMRKALRRFRPELVHTHNPRVTAIASLARHLGGARRAPLLASYHGVPPAETARAATILRRADRVACVSSGLVSDLRAAGVPPDRIALVPNGVAPAAPLAPARRAALDAELGLDDSPVVATVGRLVPQKAHERFLAAAALVQERSPEARFLVVGDGPLRAVLQEQARRLDLMRSLSFTGIRRDAPELIARCDLLVFSSDWEGLPMTALEALAAGVPVVSTEVAGMDELAAEGAAEVVPREPEALATAIVALIEDRERRLEMGQRARRLHAERFATEIMVGRYLRLYAELLDEARRR